MKRTQKLYEARAITSKLQNELMMTFGGLNGLKLNKQTYSRLAPQASRAYKELEQLINAIDSELERETGLTEHSQWAIAARNLGIK